MGIRDRDYMKRPSDDDGEDHLDSRAEEFAQDFLRKHPKFFWFCGIALAVVIVAALIMMKLSGK